MSIDRSKALAAAQKFLQKGQYDKAIAEYQRVLEVDPKDARTLLKLGDLFTRQGRSKDATRTYRRVAEQYADQGFFLKAVAVYKQILKLDPTQLDAWEKLGEMYEMLSLVSDALATFEQVATAYARAGDQEKSLDALRKMVEIDPDNIAAHIKYAEALSKAGRQDSAATAFQVAANLLEHQGRIDDYLKVAERLLYHRPGDVELARNLARLYLQRRDAKHALAKLQVCFKGDPQDVKTLELLAETFSLLGQRSKMLSVYKEVARLHQDAGRTQQAVEVLERLCRLDPDDAEARQALQRAQTRAKSASHRSPVSAGAEDDEPSIRIEEADEDDILIIEDPIELEEVTSQPAVPSPGPGAGSTPPSAKPRSPWPLGDAPPIAAPADKAADSARPPASVPPNAKQPRSPWPLGDAPPIAAPSSSAPPSAPPRDADAAGSSPSLRPEAQVQRLLTECDVFMRYGLHDKVQSQLEQVLRMEPHHVQAHERRKDLLLKTERIPEAVDALLGLADLVRPSDPERAAGYLREALSLAPDHPTARARMGELQRDTRPPAQGAEVDAASQGPDVEEDAEDDILFFDDSHDVPDSQAAPSPTTQATAGSADVVLPPLAQPRVLNTREDLPSVRLDGSSLQLDPTALETASHAVWSEPGPSADAQAMEDEAPTSEMAPPPSDQAPSDQAPPSEAPSAELPEEISDALEEADFYASQGLVAEARATLQDALIAHPDHPDLSRRLQALGAAGSQPPGPATPPPEAGDDRHDTSFLLAQKLAEALETDVEADDAGAGALDVDEVLAQFKKGVEEQIARDDTATHYDLGIAYMEMGLHDDAIEEFQLCLSSREHECTAHTMIGLSNVAKGDLESGIHHFQLGLEAGQRTDDETTALHFELGNAYELLERWPEALEHYQQALARDPAFRDAHERVERIEARLRTGDDEAEGDEFDRLFDNMILKGD